MNVVFRPVLGLLFAMYIYKNGYVKFSLRK